MDIEQMEVLENALAEINEAEGMTGVRTWIEEIDSLMGKMGYKRFLSWSGTYKRMPTSPNVNKKPHYKEEMMLFISGGKIGRYTKLG